MAICGAMCFPPAHARVCRASDVAPPSRRVLSLEFLMSRLKKGCLSSHWYGKLSLRCQVWGIERHVSGVGPQVSGVVLKCRLNRCRVSGVASSVGCRLNFTCVRLVNATAVLCGSAT